MSSNWRAVTGVLLVFVFGCISGWLSASALHYRQTTLMLQSGPDGIAALWENRTTRNLGLDDNQRKQIHEIFMENLAQRKELQKEILPQVQALNHATLKQIVAVLDPGQADLFRKNIAFFRQHYGQGPLNSKPDSQLKPRTAGPAPGMAPDGLESPPAVSTTDAPSGTTIGAPAPASTSSP
jgi:hypothetical protein